MTNCTVCGKNGELMIKSLCYDCIEEAVVGFHKHKNIVRYNEFRGLKLKDWYCGGFFGSREFDLDGAVIIHNDHDSITVQKTDGETLSANFEPRDDVRLLIESWIERDSRED